MIIDPISLVLFFGGSFALGLIAGIEIAYLVERDQ